MNFEDYKEKFTLYQQFAEKIGETLKKAIDEKHGNDFRIVKVESRAKKVESLEKKLKNRGKKESNEIEKEIKDLAGCRIIFYYNNDVDRLLQSRILHDNFSVELSETKVHYAKDNYTAYHFMIGLKEPINPEDEKFKGLRCEIQIHTMLDHAFSETAHDMTYKSINTEKYGKRALQNLEERLKKTKEVYLTPAGYELQKIKDDHGSLLKATRILEENIFDKISTASNNGVLYAILAEYKNAIPYYNDKSALLDEILSVIKQGCDRSKDIENFPDKTTADIIDVCLGIIWDIAYVNIKKTFDSLIGIYREVQDKDAREKVLTFIREKYGCYNFNILNKSGYNVQQLLLKLIQEWEDGRLKELQEIILAVFDPLLRIEIANIIQENYEGLQVGIRSLEACEDLATLRQEVIKILFKMFGLCDADQEKDKVHEVLNIATELPSDCPTSDEILRLVLQNCQDIVDFYLSLVDTESHPILEKIEQQIFFLCRRSVDKGLTEKENPIVSENNKLLAIIKRFKKNVHQNDEFNRYKIIVSQNPVLNCQWRNPDKVVSYQERHRYRCRQIEKYANLVKDNEDYWEKFIFHSLQAVENADNNKSIYLSYFLEKASENNPAFIKKLINQAPPTLNSFLFPILAGIYKSDEKLFKEVTDTNLSQGKNLSPIIKVLTLLSSADKERLHLAFDKACRLEDKPALIEIISASLYYGKKELFLKAAEKLIFWQDEEWIDRVGIDQEKYKKMMQSLAEKEIDQFLNSLVPYLDLESHEVLLFPILKRFPNKIIDYLGKRLDEKENKKNFSYQALPSQPIILVEWHKANNLPFEYRGAELLVKVFPRFNSDIENNLIEFLEKDPQSLPFIFSLLNAYKGKFDTYEIFKKIISLVPSEGRWLEELKNILRHLGVVHGEYGSKEALESLDKVIQSWESFPNDKVKIFARGFRKELYNRINQEARTADERINMCK